MASKELIEKMARAIADADMEDYREFSILYDAKAQAAISTIRASYRQAIVNLVQVDSPGEYNQGLFDAIDAIESLSASALGEQSE
ncbi:hypothetical protein DKP76_07375 [Falsochrobactrum shanghaiense]|uniref:Uncharacterized protein n=1 Tax=Falsochrobactrum shanghaiense TaxID=2201899 RepID=A0A316JI08_9HYPH|nr:hypothetical protein [Falsochrobactrum shanghaiense]PWL18873.1 hypothetical protein DKP76_07375 [Falsochrobactrum shanghaiense]